MVGGAEETGGNTSETGARGSPVCLAIRDRSPRGLSSASSSLSDPGGGIWKARGLARHQSIVEWPHSLGDSLIEARSGT